MKILHIVNVSFVLPYYLGKQIDYFKSKNYEIHIACSPSEHLSDFVNEKSIYSLPIEIKRKISPAVDIIAIYKLYRYIKKNKFDVVVGHTPKGAMIAMIAAFMARVKKRIFFRHGLVYETSAGTKRSLLIHIERLTSFCATKVVCVSPSVLNESRRLRLSNSNKLMLLNKGTCNGIDLTVFRRFEQSISELDYKEKYKIRNKRVIGFVGRLVQDKGVLELINAWKLLIEKYRDITLLLVGPFENRDAVDDNIKTYIQNEPTIICTGLVDNTVPFYNIIDILVLPSYREGFPTVVLEASAMGIPVLTTKVTGCIDSIIEGETGLYISLEPEDIVKKISILLDDKNYACMLGKNGRDFVKTNFCQENIWSEIDSKLFNTV